MTTSIEVQEKIASLNTLFLKNMLTIEAIQEQLLKSIILKNLSNADLADAQEYIQDKVNIFRFLKDAKFNEAEALEKLETVLSWRIDQHIAQLSIRDCIEFFGGDDQLEQQQALTFFHHVDNSGHFPLVFVRLAHFPSLKKLFASSSSSSVKRRKKLVDHVQPYACFIMEMARKLTWDMTKDRMRRGERFVLVAEIMALVNVSKAPMIPIDADLIRAMSVILDHRFPGMVDSIHVFNFNWLYQGLWSVLKYLLSEDAKKSIQFNTVKDVQSIISQDRILTEMGGTDSYLWSVINDEVLQKYGTGKPIQHEQVQEEEEEKARQEIAADQQRISRLSHAADPIPPAPRDTTVAASPANRLDNSRDAIRNQNAKSSRAVSFALDSPTATITSSSKSTRSDSGSESDIFFDAINDSTSSSPPLSLTAKQPPQQTKLAQQQLPPSPPLSEDTPPRTTTILLPPPKPPHTHMTAPALPNTKPHTLQPPQRPSPPPPPTHHILSAANESKSATSPPSFYSKTHALRSGADVLSSFISKRRESFTPIVIQQQQQQHQPSITVSSQLSSFTTTDTITTTSQQQHRSSAPITTAKHDNDTFVITIHLQEIQLLLKHYTHSLFQWTVGHRGLLYWALLYLFVRGPVEGLVHRSITRFSLSLRNSIEKQTPFAHVHATTMGVTATVAALMSTGVSFTLEKFRHSSRMEVKGKSSQHDKK